MSCSLVGMVRSVFVVSFMGHKLGVVRDVSDGEATTAVVEWEIAGLGQVRNVRLILFCITPKGSLHEASQSVNFHHVESILQTMYKR